MLVLLTSLYMVTRLKSRVELEISITNWASMKYKNYGKENPSSFFTGESTPEVTEEEKVVD